MAEEDENGAEKTEDPSEKKLRDAQERGDVAKSQEVNTWFIMAASLIVLQAFRRIWRVNWWSPSLALSNIPIRCLSITGDCANSGI